MYVLFSRIIVVNYKLVSTFRTSSYLLELFQPTSAKWNYHNLKLQFWILGHCTGCNKLQQGRNTLGATGKKYEIPLVIPNEFSSRTRTIQAHVHDRLHNARRNAQYYLSFIILLSILSFIFFLNFNQIQGRLKKKELLKFSNTIIESKEQRRNLANNRFYSRVKIDREINLPRF